MQVAIGDRMERAQSKKDRLRVKRKTLETVLEQCQIALELLSTTPAGDDGDGAAFEEGQEDGGGLSVPLRDEEADKLCTLLKSGVECPDFLEKLESAQASIPQNMAAEGSSWDWVSDDDIWEYGSIDDHEEYVLVRQEDIMEGIACFTAAYLLSLKQTKDLTPNQLQDALSKMFSTKKRKGKLRKAWDGSKVVYNIASWGATAVGIYQNPAILRAANTAFWTSCHVFSKLF